MDAEALQRAREMMEGRQDILPKQTVSAPPDGQNPAERPGGSRERKRIPMSVPVQRLAVPEIPGWHLHWFLNTRDRIQRALQAGYVFVSWDEVELNNLDIGGDSAASGNTDMGSNVSIVSGGEVGTDGQVSRLVLMKLRQEHWNEDQARIEDHHEQIAQAIRGGQVGAGKVAGENARDIATRYTKATDNLFTRKPKR